MVKLSGVARLSKELSEWQEDKNENSGQGSRRSDISHILNSCQ